MLWLMIWTDYKTHYKTSKRNVIMIHQKTIVNKKYVLSNSESVQCNFFIWNKRNVTFIQFKICCCVQNFIKIGWFFTEIWRYIDFQNRIVLPPYETTHKVSVAGRSRLSNIMSIWYTDLKIWIFRTFGSKCLFRP